MCLKGCQKDAQNRGNAKYVKYVKSVARNGIFGPKRFNIFNMSLVLGTLREKHLTLPLFREATFTKQGEW